MAITSERIWDAPPLPAPPSDDVFVFGEPSDPDRLPYRFDWSRAIHRATDSFFDERDPGYPVRSTVGKILGVIVVLTGIALITLGSVAALAVWTIKAVLG